MGVVDLGRNKRTNSSRGSYAAVALIFNSKFNQAIW